MEIIIDIIKECGVTLLLGILTVVAGYLGRSAKKLYAKYINDNTIQTVVKNCVQAVEQLYKDLHGEEKFKKAVEHISAVLGEKGIPVGSEELKMLIESAVGEFNEVFKKTE